MRKSSLFLVAYSLAAGFCSHAIAQGVNLDCENPADSLSYYCNHRDQFGKNAPASAMDPYSPDGAGVAAPQTTGSVAGQAPAPDQARIASCEQRYRTYDPVSHTFQGRDGRRHVCQ